MRKLTFPTECADWPDIHGAPLTTRRPFFYELRLLRGGIQLVARQIWLSQKRPRKTDFSLSPPLQLHRSKSRPKFQSLPKFPCASPPDEGAAELFPFSDGETRYASSVPRGFRPLLQSGI
jgi:hypothetical protein